jgi:hypothetical protein
MITMIWHGPYAPAEVALPDVGLEKLEPGDQLAVSAADAAGLLAADEAWWSVQLDGGSAGSTYTDGIDGGTSRFLGAAPFLGAGASG